MTGRAASETLKRRKAREEVDLQYYKRIVLMLAAYKVQVRRLLVVYLSGPTPILVFHEYMVLGLLMFLIDLHGQQKRRVSKGSCHVQ
ncbi:hypothetical protein BC629DRAFT_1556763 [Irpex lacteus]|nr:hypothetical protein BC629DRAFT_1556763 [Irpex lacteus]